MTYGVFQHKLENGADNPLGGYVVRKAISEASEFFAVDFPWPYRFTKPLRMFRQLPAAQRFADKLNEKV